MSVVVPVLNEERHLEAAVTNVLEQDYPGALDVVLAVGPSRDRTADVAARLARRDARVHVVDNPTGRTPAGLNAAIKASTGDVVVRVDAHSELSPGYVRRAVELLEQTGADNVGGLMLAQGRTPFEKAVARAMGSRLGIGGARFHVGGEEGEAETVYLGVFRRTTLDRLGGFDEHFHRAQDWELNHRIRLAGGTIWFSPELWVTYRPRSSWKALALPVLPHRALAPAGDAPLPRDREPALPRAAGRRRRHHAGHRRGRRRHRRRAVVAAPRLRRPGCVRRRGHRRVAAHRRPTPTAASAPGSRWSSPPCTSPGAPAS